MQSDFPTYSRGRDSDLVLPCSSSDDSDAGFDIDMDNQCAVATPNSVIINLSTQLSIPDYSFFYHTPIESFTPSFSALPDGSLVTDPFLLAIRVSNMDLLMIGIMLTLFVRNVIVSADYIRRGRVRYKALFYVLLVSQLLGLLCFLAKLVPFFLHSTNCFAVNIIVSLTTSLSISLLITNILGIKAYRCLGDSIFVLLVILSLQTGSLVLVALDLPSLQSSPRLSGSCRAQSKLRFIPWAFVVCFVESVFIFFCFLYAVWKASKTPPAVPNRLSVAASTQLSQNNSAEEAPQIESSGPEVITLRPRGWWDYIPESEPEPEEKSNLNAGNKGNVLDRFIRIILRREDNGDPSAKVIDSSVTSSTDRQSESEGNEKEYLQSPRSLVSRIRYFTMQIPFLHEVMRSELRHITLIALTHVIFATFALIGGFDYKLKFSQQYFINANWAALSLLVIHSFERVVTRNEREALFQQPYEWTPTFQGGIGMPSPVSVQPLHRIRRIPAPPLGQLAPGDEDSGPTSPNHEQTGHVIVIHSGMT